MSMEDEELLGLVTNIVCDISNCSFSKYSEALSILIKEVMVIESQPKLGQ